MRNILILCILAPTLLSANLLSLKRDLELKIKMNLVEQQSNHLMNRFMFLNGKSQAYFEILEMIELMEIENASQEKRIQD